MSTPIYPCERCGYELDELPIPQDGKVACPECAHLQYPGALKELTNIAARFLWECCRPSCVLAIVCAGVVATRIAANLHHTISRKKPGPWRSLDDLMIGVVVLISLAYPFWHFWMLRRRVYWRPFWGRLLTQTVVGAALNILILIGGLVLGLMLGVVIEDWRQ